MTRASGPGSDTAPLPGWVHAIGGHVARHPGFWRKLANFESRVLADELTEIRIDRPVHVCGLARSGTTIILETLARHSQTVSHCYGDYPFTYVPFWWNWLLARMPRGKEKPQERIHGDGILVTAESPEALEETLWMAFFDHLHTPHMDNRLTAETSNASFERFYTEHIRKLLLINKGKRYLAKGNYNLTRIPYLLKIFPDARFVVPVRNPVWHIASLMKQHRLFCAAQQESPALLEHMRRVGHFEFGLDWRPINPGNAAATMRILELWESGDQIRAWAAYWALIHGHIRDLAVETPALSIVMYEELCARPLDGVSALLDHCGLSVEPGIMEFAKSLHLPDYYRPEFSTEELKIIEAETGEVAAGLRITGKATAVPDED